MSCSLTAKLSADEGPLSAQAQAITAFIDAVGSFEPSASVFNPWSTAAVDDLTNGPACRRERLRSHLSCPKTELVMIGEAAGWRGARISGIAFTSERLLRDGAIPRIAAARMRLTNWKRELSEPSASVVWNVLYELGVANQTVLWNAFPLHPHRVGEPFTNRAPSGSELLAGATILEHLLSMFPTAMVVAIGNHAGAALKKLGHAQAPTVRHPSYGGATIFRRCLRAALTASGIARPQPQLLEAP